MYKKILIAVDSRANSIDVARVGFSLAGQLVSQAALVFVVDEAGTAGNLDAGIMPEEALLILKKEAQRTVEQLLKLNHQSSDTLSFLPVGQPKEEILKTAEAWGADLIVVGIRGKSGFSLWAMGSTTQYITLHSSIPVMIVPTGRS